VKKRRVRPEVLVIIAILLVSLSVLLVMYLGRTPGGSVVVRLDGVETARYSLYADGVYELNGGSNVLVIAEGVAYMEQANCPDHVCINQGRIAYEGQCITCLPNRLTVTVEGAVNETGGVQVDIISS